MSKKIVSGLLALTFFFGILFGCAKPTGPVGPDGTESTAERVTEAPETGTVTEDPRIEPNLPHADFDGQSYRMYVSEYSTYRTWEDLWVEEAGSEPISVAVYNRNAKIQERYSVKIEMKQDQYLDYENTITKNVQSNDDFADVLVSLGDNIQRLYGYNVFYNLADVPHLEFDKPWWNQDSVRSFNINGYMPFGICDLTINDFGVAAAFLFNKVVAKDYGVGDVYQIVGDGEWTLDKMIELGKKVADSDNAPETARYALTGDDGMVNVFFISGGGRYVLNDDDGLPYDAFWTERNVNLVQYYLQNILFRDDFTFNGSIYNQSDVTGGEMKSSYKRTIFAEDRALFMQGGLGATEVLRYSIESDFGIIPCPKYDLTQKDYASLVSPYGGSVISIPLNVADEDFAGLILEALSAESTYTLVPAFYDIVLKTKNTRDEESKEMIDIILRTRVYDIGLFYNFGNFAQDMVFMTGCQEWHTGVKQTSDVASYYKKYETKIEKGIDKLIRIMSDWT